MSSQGMINYLIKNEKRYKPERFSELLVNEIKAYFKEIQIIENEGKIKQLLTINKELLEESISKWTTQIDNAKNDEEYSELNNLILLATAIFKSNIL